MRRAGKISSIIFLIVIFALLIFLSMNLDEEKAYTINVIELNGDIHLTADQYFNYAKLDDKDSYKNLTLPIIKDRIDKHPYIVNADVKYDGMNKVTITITEKTFEVIVIVDNQKYLVTDKFELLPVLPFTRKMDYPLISNPDVKGNFELFRTVKTQADIILASKMITAAKLLDAKLYQEISEIDMRKGRDILIYLSSINYPVVIGRGDEIKKVVYFNRLWSYLKNKDVNSLLAYIDLRFKNNIYLGLAVDDGQSEESTI